MGEKIKMLVGLTLCLCLALLGGIPAAYGGGNPPTGTEHYMGPALLGTLTITKVDEQSVLVRFDTKCRGQEESIEMTLDIEYGAINEESLMHFRFPGTIEIIPAECQPQADSWTPIITQVLSFEEGTLPGGGTPVKIAKVIFLYVVPR